MSPWRLPKPCAFPGCAATVPAGERYCEKHRKQEAQKYDRERGSAASRGYNARWRRVRAQILAEEPLCRRHFARGEIVPAVEVHHIDGDVTNLARENLEPLCKQCHARETAKSGQRWGNRH